ncbi:hypothetical protein RHGRI_036415 [Rhododendron griersonianum]|uniref:Yippee domain-containing protein n=1 Tax=Rhododendron griersonianum TaxID=479676 RepID=A0AAV6HNE4_9ERIC|nr:hypothetical protein RHGRI_036415 [Rhododendron griersonianum]
MGRVFLLQFDQTPENEFYVCRKCQTHIALERERKALHEDVSYSHLLFEQAINWHSLGEESNRRVGNYVAAEIYCNNCGSPLGLQFIEVPNDVVFVRAKEKDIFLHGSKLLLWDGNEIVPVPESEDEVEEDEDAHESEDEVEEDEVDEGEVDEDEDEVDGNDN